jgi:hypothetical protein
VTIKETLAELLKKYGIDIEAALISFGFKKTGGLDVKVKGSLKVKAKSINIYFIRPDATQGLLAAHAGGLVRRSEEGLFGFTRSDLAGYDAITLAAQMEDSDLLSTMARVVPPDDLAALSISLNIRRYEALGHAARAFQLRRELRRRYGERGNRICVFYGTGLLREFMWPFLAMVEFTPTITEKQKAKEVFDRCIEHMEHAVYVNAEFTPDRLVQEVRFRLEVDKARVVLVFGLGGQVIGTVKEGVRQIREFEAERQVSKLAHQGGLFLDAYR